MSKTTIKKILWFLVFGIAMAFLETAIVIYLRKLYYADGFNFPLKIIDADIAVTELIRELATMVMLLGIGIVAGRKNIERFAYFILSFAIWDIFYYVFLKIMLGWPESFLTWDILFLLPTIWVGPVLAPIINSVTMILLAFSIIRYVEKKGSTHVSMTEWLLLVAGSLLVIFSYTQEFSSFLLSRYSFSELIRTGNIKEIITLSSEYIPEYFNWWIFAIAELMHIAAIALIILRNKKIPA